MNSIANKDIEYFLQDIEQNSYIELIEGAEKQELETIAEHRGINLKDSRDLAIFKTIYAFTDRPNANGAILPTKELLKVLPQIVGKPININHNRRLVVGHYIDYRYIQKDNKIIAYGVFYKSNFGEEWDSAKQYFKNKKLSSSFEIWSPKTARKYINSSEFELHQMEIAGGALIFQDGKNRPAFEGADVLELAKVLESLPELVYASKHSEEDIVKADYWHESVKENLKKLEQDKQTVQPTITVVPTPEPPPIPKITCSNCQEVIETALIENIKCPKCLAILDKEGKMIYPPQIQDFNLNCPSCRSRNWLLLENKENSSDIRCLSCSKEYTVNFAQTEEGDLKNRIQFLYTSMVSCIQCNSAIMITCPSQLKTQEVICKRCGVRFNIDLDKVQKSKNIVKVTSKIVEERSQQPMEVNTSSESTNVIETSSVDPITSGSTDTNTTGASEVAPVLPTESQNLEESSKTEVKEESSQNSEISISSETQTSAISTETVIVDENVVQTVSTETSTTTEEVQPVETPMIAEKQVPEESICYTKRNVEKIKEDEYDMEEEEGKKITYEERQKLEDNSFAVVKTVKNKITGKDRKIRMFPIQDEAHVRNALARLPQAIETLQRLGISPREVKNSILKRARTLKMTDLLKRYKEEAKCGKKRSQHMEHAIKKIIALKKEKILATAKANDELAKIKKEADEKIEVYKASAQLIISRKLELGQYSENLTEKEMLDDEIFAKTKLTKENAELKAQSLGGNEIVTSKITKTEDDYDRQRKEIDKIAFGHLRR